MAATKSQGSTFALFMAGLTAVCAGLAFFSSGAGKGALVLGLIAVAYSVVKFVSLKPLEGKVALGVQPALMKLAGVVTVLLGWLIVLFGLHLTATLSGRFITTILGFGISLIGVLYILPTASSKNAIWKA